MGLFVQDFQVLIYTQPSSVSMCDNNVINSVVEFVSEVVLNKVNAMPEINNKSNKDLQAQKLDVFKLVEFNKPFIQLPTVAAPAVVLYAKITDYPSQFCTEITPPPPKA